MTLTPTAPLWYCGFWVLMLGGWYLASRYAVLWALKQHDDDRNHRKTLSRMDTTGRSVASRTAGADLRIKDHR